MIKLSRNGMKIVMRMVIFLLGVMLTTQKAHADVIWEPADSFYEMHSDECDYINRLYTANGPDGEVIAYKSPENSSIVKKYENASRIRIIHVYTDKKGVEWGVYETGDQTGWIPLDYMAPVYDYICFEEEFGDDIVIEEGELDKQFLGLQVYFWYAPGSPEGNAVVLTNYTPEYSHTYIDAEGRKWGYFYYYMGYKNKWICLDDPQADYETLWQEETPVLGENLKKPTFSDDRIVPGGSASGGLGPSIVISVILVAVVVVVTLRLLKKLKSQKFL